MAKPDTQKLVCSACSHENEVERVYCHNCGEKLDRSLLPKVEETGSEEDQKKVKKRVKKMMNPKRVSLLRNARTFVLVVAFSAVVAAVFLVCQAPEGTPPLKSDRMPDSEISDLWFGMMNTRPAVSQTFKEYDINYFLARSLKATDGSGGIKFQRAFVKLTPGEITVTEQRDALGLPLYTSVTFKPVLKDGKWTAEIVRHRFGRLGIHSSIGNLAGGKLTDVVLQGIKKALDKELKEVDRLQTIEPGDGAITLVTKPAQ